MKSIYFSFIFLSVIFLGSCTQSGKKTETEAKGTLVANEKVAKIQVLYFHGARQCPSCVAIGAEAQSLLKENYQSKVDAGEIAFKEINVDEEPNFAIAEKYQIAGSALLIVKTVNGKEEITDLTGDGFKLAKNMPDMFKVKVTTSLDVYLK